MVTCAAPLHLEHDAAAGEQEVGQARGLPAVHLRRSYSEIRFIKKGNTETNTEKQNIILKDKRLLLGKTHKKVEFLVVEPLRSIYVVHICIFVRPLFIFIFQGV